MFLIACLAFFFLIAVHINTVRFHQVTVQHIFIFSLDVFASVHAGPDGQIPNSAPRTDHLLQIKIASAPVTWEKLNEGPASSQGCSFD